MTMFKEQTCLKKNKKKNSACSHWIYFGWISLSQQWAKSCHWFYLSSTSFNDTNSLDQEIKEGKMCHILWDYNIHLLRSETHSPAQEFLNNLCLNYFIPIIHKPTGVTDRSATLIANAVTSVLNKVQLFGIFQLSGFILISLTISPSSLITLKWPGQLYLYTVTFTVIA